jgi:hypothetical protein
MTVSTEANVSGTPTLWYLNGRKKYYEAVNDD